MPFILKHNARVLYFNLKKQTVKKKNLKIILVLLLTISPFYGLTQQINWSEKSEIKKLVKSQYSSFPSYIAFKQNQEISVNELPNWMIKTFNFSTNISFRLLKTETDQLGHQHNRYQQTYKGIPIEDAIWIAHISKNNVYALNGLIYPEIKGVIANNISENEALLKAQDFIGADTYKWELPKEEDHLKWETNNPDATYVPVAELVYISGNGSFEVATYRLAYKFDIYAHQPLYRAYVYVDAASGKIIRENLRIHHVDETGNATTVYSADREIIADSFVGGYRLRDASRGDGVRTFDLNQSTEYGDALDFTDDDNDWDNVNPQLDEYATDAHWATERTYDYYFDIHGRNSIDNTGFPLNSYVHFSINYVNAFWDGSRMTYGDGDGFDIEPLTSLDIAGHEVTHGLTENSAGLIYADESGALNESFSDIFGNAIERFARPDDWDWLLGADIGWTIRSMSNPNDYNCPDTYFGDFWAPLGGGDSGGVHTNSGVQNFWFYLLSEGGTGTNDNGDEYTIEGIGIEAASAIAFRNLTVYLTPSSGFADAREFSIQAANDLFGECSEESIQTANAWYAVGVGMPFTTEVIASFSADETESCEFPFTVNFENESANGDVFLWTFGDGTTSTLENPSHTYLTNGEFTVTLTVEGGICDIDGSDEVTEVNYIKIDDEVACEVDFPATGTGPVQTACNGRLYDSGGPDGFYGNEEDAIMTIAPTGASSVQLIFNMFNVEYDTDCFYDYLNVYDGPSTSATLIGSNCDANMPTVINSSGGALTLEFHSDFSVVGNGFEIDWTCEVIDFTATEEFNSEKITLYPNPSTGFITLTTGSLNTGTIEVSDVTGRLITTLPFASNSTMVDLSATQTKGIYLIKIKNSQGVLVDTKKLVLK